MFVVPKLYHQYRNLFELIFGQENSSNKQLANISHVMSEYWIMIKARNEVFCGTLEENEMKNTNNNNHTRQAETSEISGDEERVVHILDSIGKNADSNVGLLLNGEQWMDIRGHSAQSASKAIFGTMRIESFKFIKLISIMCQWATSESRYGDWKAYLVTSVLLAWRDQDKSQERNDLLQDALIRFLDNETKKDHVDDNDDRISAGSEFQLGGEYGK
jgi:hypothetical protein